MSDTQNNPPAEGTVINSAKPVGVANEYPPMSKVEAGVIITVLAGIVTAVGFGIRADMKNQEEYARKLKLERDERDLKASETRKARSKWFDDQRKSKRVVLELRDGAYIAISADAYAECEIKKKGEWL